MRYPGTIENIEHSRLQQGIEDIELHEAIRRLVVGDIVQLTLVTGPKSFECVRVQITSIEGGEFHGKLVRKPESPALAKFKVRAVISFTAAHIHSIPRDNGTARVDSRPAGAR